MRLGLSDTGVLLLNRLPRALSTPEAARSVFTFIDDGRRLADRCCKDNVIRVVRSYCSRSSVDSIIYEDASLVSKLNMKSM